MSAPRPVKLGPGVLVLDTGATGYDISCRLSKARVDWDKDKEDDTEVLCGSTIAGAVTYSAKLAGTFAQDIDEANSFVQYTWDHKGEQVPFTFVPNNAAERAVTGVVTVDPLMVGGDEVKKNMWSDFEWDCVGEPVLGAATPATGATAGTPGGWTPAGSVPPATVAELTSSTITASPATAWTTGQYVTVADGSKAHWDAAAWTAGVA